MAKTRPPVIGPEADRRMLAGVDLLGRTGAEEFQIRYDDGDDGAGPVVWIALGQWGGDRWEAAAAMGPVAAVMRLCEQVIDGGMCKHCDRPTGFSPDPEAMPMDELVCWYQFDPELSTFRRGCAGDDK